MPIESMKLSSDKRLCVLFHDFYFTNLPSYISTFAPCRIDRLSTTSHDSIVKIWDASLEVMDNELFSEEEEGEEEEEEEELKDRVTVDVGGKRSRESDEDTDEDAEQEAGEEDDDDSESDSDDERKPKAKKTKKSFAVDRNRDFFAELD